MASIERRPRALTPLSLFLQGTGMLFLGGFFLLAPEKALALTADVLRWGLLVSGAMSLTAYWGKPGKRNALTLAQGLALPAAAALLWAFPQWMGIGASVFFGLWMLANALFKLIFAFQLFSDRAQGKIRALATGLIHLAFGLILMMDGGEKLAALWMILGVYFLVYGFFLLSDSVRELLLWDLDGRHIKRRIRVAPPVLMTALIPQRLLRSINESLKAGEGPSAFVEVVAPDAPPIPLAPALEVFFHLSKETAMGFGHVDICLKDTAWSYGCYNQDSNRLWGILSQGILVSAPREKYIRHCLTYEKKRLIGFTLLLTARQAELAESAIQAFLRRCSPWFPPEQFKNGDTSAKMLETATGARFYRVEEGPFQTYNFAKTNCVALADVICGSSCLDLMNMNGIVTPGAYYAFLDQQFQRKNSIVAKKTIYR